MSLIETVDLYQRLGDRDILKNINIRIERGEVFDLIGQTGSGKTTLLRLLDLIDTPDRGQLYFDGTDVTESAKLRLEARRRMAFVLQKPVVFNTTVYDNIAYGLRWRGMYRSDIRIRWPLPGQSLPNRKHSCSTNRRLTLTPSRWRESRN